MNLISVIVPFLNEEDCIEAFCGHIETVAQNKPYEIEIIFVDDGSTDLTVKKIQEFKFEHCKHVKAVSLSKNFGSHAAIRAGLQNAGGDYFVFICADLQEPADIVDVMYNNITNGLDVVKVEKITVKQDFIGRAFGLVTAALIRKYAVKDYGSGGISNIMFNKKVLLFLNENIEPNTSIVLQIIDAGFKSVTVGMNYNSRSAGVSKWTFSKRIKLFIDSFVSFSFMPIRLVSLVGILMFVIGVTLGIITVINRLINPDFVAGFATISSILLFGFGITNISLGIIAEYLWRTYDSSRRRPVFIVSEIKNIK